MLDITVANFTLNIVTLMIFPVFLVTGWIVTRKQYQDQAAQYRAEIDRLLEENARHNREHDEEIARILATNKELFEQQQLAYARMSAAKDDQIDRLQAYMNQWKDVALGTLTGLKAASQNAVTVAEAAVEKLGG